MHFTQFRHSCPPSLGRIKFYDDSRQASIFCFCSKKNTSMLREYQYNLPRDKDFALMDVAAPYDDAKAEGISAAGGLKLA